MSKLLKEIEPGENQERLAKLLQEGQGLDRSSRKARISSGGYSDPPDSPSTPARRERRTLVSSSGPSDPPGSSAASPRRDRRSGQSTTTASKSTVGESSVGKSPLGKGQLWLSNTSPRAAALGAENPKIKIKIRDPSFSQQSPKETSTANSPASDPTQSQESPSMASQRNRPGRGGPRGATNDLTEEKDLWQQILPHLAALSKAEARAAEVNKEIFENEAQKKDKASAGISTLSTPPGSKIFLTICRTFHRRHRAPFHPLPRTNTHGGRPKGTCYGRRSTLKDNYIDWYGQTQRG